jgi:hypothetical protein
VASLCKLAVLVQRLDYGIENLCEGFVALGITSDYTNHLEHWVADIVYPGLDAFGESDSRPCGAFSQPSVNRAVSFEDIGH